MRGGGRPSTSSIMEPTASLRSPSPDVACSQVGIPVEVLQIAQLSAGERVRQEWSQRRAPSNTAANLKSPSSFSSSSPRSIGSCGSASPNQESHYQRREALERAKHDALVQKLSSRQAPQDQPATTPRPTSALSLWSRTKEVRFSYQYGNFERAYPQFVPRPSLVYRAPALGSYGKSTSFVV